MSFQDVDIKDLNIERIKDFVGQHSCMTLHNPNGELFQGNEDEKGLFIDVPTLNGLVTIYDNLNKQNKNKFNDVLQSEYKLAHLLDKMWDVLDHDPNKMGIF